MPTRDSRSLVVNRDSWWHSYLIVGWTLSLRERRSRNKVFVESCFWLYGWWCMALDDDSVESTFSFLEICFVGFHPDIFKDWQVGSSSLTLWVVAHGHLSWWSDLSGEFRYGTRPEIAWHSHVCIAPGADIVKDWQNSNSFLILRVVGHDHLRWWSRSISLSLLLRVGYQRLNSSVSVTCRLEIGGRYVYNCFSTL